MSLLLLLPPPPTPAFLSFLLLLISSPPPPPPSPDPSQQDRSLLPLQLRLFPSGTSARTIVHTVQGVDSGSFQSFDRGHSDNLTRVDLARVTPPHAVYLGKVASLIPVPAPVHYTGVCT